MAVWPFGQKCPDGESPETAARAAACPSHGDCSLTQFFGRPIRLLKVLEAQRGNADEQKTLRRLNEVDTARFMEGVDSVRRQARDRPVPP